MFLKIAVLALTITCATFLLLMTLYQLYLVLPYRRLRGPDPAPKALYAEDDLPQVTVQLPVYNEGRLADQILRLAAALDYPHHKLQIQYLDDSDDGETSALARVTFDELQVTYPDIDFQFLRRGDRTGFKAGALKAGTEAARGEFLAIFDADFQIPADYLRRMIHHFNDPTVGAVQARWDYLNEGASLFSRLQANKLDAHQMFEQAGRARMGLVTIFHGTAGIWRRQALDDAGGWNCISEVEDVEITIRAASAGWNVVYLDHMRIFSELPENVNAFLRQQMRWRRGWTRIVLNYTGPILRSPLSLRERLDLLLRIHLTWGPVAALISTLGVLPCFMIASEFGIMWLPFVLYTGSLVVALILRHFETRTLEEDPVGRQPLDTPRLLTILPMSYILFNLGMLWPLAQATLEGCKKGQIWEVTPKSGTTAGSLGHAATERKKVPSYVLGTISLCVVAAVLTLYSVISGFFLATMFYGMLAVGCALIAILLLEFFGRSPSLTQPIIQAIAGRN